MILKKKNGAKIPWTTSPKTVYLVLTHQPLNRREKSACIVKIEREPQHTSTQKTFCKLLLFRIEAYISFCQSLKSGSTLVIALDISMTILLE